jgi:ribosomal protection tetracycline resistance protein
VAFPAPRLESVVSPVEPGEMTRLREALEQLAEQDPLISLRQRNDEGELSVRLYGDVQREVIQETLAREHGVAATFGPSRVVCVERPVGVGERAEWIGDADNPFAATVGSGSRRPSRAAAFGTSGSWGRRRRRTTGRSRRRCTRPWRRVRTGGR